MKSSLSFLFLFLLAGQFFSPFLAFQSSSMFWQDTLLLPKEVYHGKEKNSNLCVGMEKSSARATLPYDWAYDKDSSLYAAVPSTGIVVQPNQPTYGFGANGDCILMYEVGITIYQAEPIQMGFTLPIQDPLHLSVRIERTLKMGVYLRGKSRYIDFYNEEKGYPERIKMK